MKRLTKRSENGTGVYATPSGDPIKWDDNRHKVLQKLADYEDLEDQGRLLILPCAVGDTVYVPHRGHIQEMIITMVSWDVTGYFFSWRLNSGVYPNLDGFSEHKIGKTVFLTREEAKAALEKLKGEEHE